MEKLKELIEQNKKNLMPQGSATPRGKNELTKTRKIFSEAIISGDFSTVKEIAARVPLDMLQDKNNPNHFVFLAAGDDKQEIFKFLVHSGFSIHTHLPKNNLMDKAIGYSSKELFNFCIENKVESTSKEYVETRKQYEKYIKKQVNDKSRKEFLENNFIYTYALLMAEDELLVDLINNHLDKVSNDYFVDAYFGGELDFCMNDVYDLAFKNNNVQIVIKFENWLSCHEKYEILMKDAIADWWSAQSSIPSVNAYFEYCDIKKKSIDETLIMKNYDGYFHVCSFSSPEVESFLFKNSIIKEHFIHYMGENLEAQKGSSVKLVMDSFSKEELLTLGKNNKTLFENLFDPAEDYYELASYLRSKSNHKNIKKILSFLNSREGAEYIMDVAKNAYSGHEKVKIEPFLVSLEKLGISHGEDGKKIKRNTNKKRSMKLL